MAIKTVSWLDPFANGTGAASGQRVLGEHLHFFDKSALTDKDKLMGLPAAINSFDAASYSDGATTSLTSVPIANGTTYWKSLFELSLPTVKSTTSDSLTFEYNSYSIKYDELMKNILLDVKAFLNFRNRLYDYDLSGIVNGNLSFTGNKSLLGNLSVSNNFFALNISSCTLTAISAAFKDSLTATSALISNLSASSLSAKNASILNLSAMESLYIGDILSVELANPDFYWGGYAYGLKDDASTFTNCGTYLSNINYLGEPERRGDPVCFKDGRPWELTCVNYAVSAYNLVDLSTGKLWDVGSARMVPSANWGGTSWSGWTPQDTVVKFKNGVPVSCNVIDFANHALWSDLGEKYSSDKPYEPGTLVKFGGEKEITIADTEVNAIVSTKAFSLNTLLKDGVTIALCGRVPTKVKGKILKFDKIMLSDTPGIACKWDGVSRVIGRALENSDDELVKLVECVTSFLL